MRSPTASSSACTASKTSRSSSFRTVASDSPASTRSAARLRAELIGPEELFSRSNTPRASLASPATRALCSWLIVFPPFSVRLLAALALLTVEKSRFSRAILAFREAESLARVIRLSLASSVSPNRFIVVWVRWELAAACSTSSCRV